jgi:molecular chaperone DnaK
VILVGGTTKIPYVRDQVAKFFARAPRTDVSPEDAVAIGAGLQATSLERILKRKSPSKVTGAQRVPQEFYDDGNTTQTKETINLDDTDTQSTEPNTDVPMPQVGADEDSILSLLPQTPARPVKRPTAGYEQRRPPTAPPDYDRPAARGQHHDRFEERTPPVAAPPVATAPIGRLTKHGFPVRESGESLTPPPATPPAPPKTTQPKFTATQPAQPRTTTSERAQPPALTPRTTTSEQTRQQPPALTPRQSSTAPSLAAPPPPRPSRPPTSPPAGLAPLGPMLPPTSPTLIVEPPKPPAPPPRFPPPEPEPATRPAMPMIAAHAATMMIDPEPSSAASTARGMGPAAGDTAPMSPATTAPGFVPPQTYPVAPQSYPVPQQPIRNPVVLDVTPRGLGVGTVAGYCEELIRRNSRVPTEIRKLFTTSRDAQDTVRIIVCQGESRRLDNNVVIGDLTLGGLPVRPRGETSIEVTFFLDASGILQVKARDAHTGKEQRASLDLVGAMPQAEVQASRERMQSLRR